MCKKLPWGFIRVPRVGIIFVLCCPAQQKACHHLAFKQQSLLVLAAAVAGKGVHCEVKYIGDPVEVILGQGTFLNMLISLMVPSKQGFISIPSTKDPLKNAFDIGFLIL